MIKTLNNLMYIFIIMVFSWIFISSQWLNSNVYYSQNRIITYIVAILILIVWLILIKLLKKKSVSNKLFYISLSVYLAIIFLIEFFVIKNLSVNPGWDFGVIYDNSLKYALTGTRNGATYLEYFSLFPNNILIFILEVIFIKLGLIFGINGLHSCYLMNIICINIGLLLLISTIKKKYGNNISIFSMIISLFFVALYLYTPIFYSDTLSVFVPIGFVLIYNLLSSKRDTKKKDIFIFIIIGFLMFYGKEIKITSLIILISIIIKELLEHKNIRRGLYFIISISIFLVLSMTFKIIINKTSFIDERYEKYPYTHWIMMGVEDIDKDNSGRNSYGGYNIEDYNLTNEHIKSHDAVSFNLKEYKNRVSKMGFIGYMNYLNKKAVNTWTDGFYFSDVKLSVQQKHINEKVYNFLFVEHKDVLLYFTQGIQFAFIIILIVSCILSFNKNTEFDYIILSIIGLFIFFLFWENRSRYLYNYIPIFIYLIVTFYNTLSFERKKK